jgi:hypothetical protein
MLIYICINVSLGFTRLRRLMESRPFAFLETSTVLGRVFFSAKRIPLASLPAAFSALAAALTASFSSLAIAFC